MGLKNSILMQRFNVGGLYLIDVYVGKIRLTITGMTVAGTFLMERRKKFQWSEPQIHSRWLYPSDFEASLVLRLFVSISIRVKAEIDFNWKNIDSREFAETFYHEKSQKHEFKKKWTFLSNSYTKRVFYGKSFRLESFREAGATLEITRALGSHFTPNKTTQWLH